MDNSMLDDYMLDDFNAFRYDMIQKILIEEEIEIRSSVEAHYKYKRKSAKFIKAECKKKLDSVREKLYATSTFELLLKLLERNKDEMIITATSKAVNEAIDKIDNSSYVITRQRSWGE